MGPRPVEVRPGPLPPQRKAVRDAQPDLNAHGFFLPVFCRANYSDFFVESGACGTSGEDAPCATHQMPTPAITSGGPGALEGWITRHTIHLLSVLERGNEEIFMVTSV